MFRLREWANRVRGIPQWPSLPPQDGILPMQQLDFISKTKVDEYRNARPFPHLVMDGLFNPRLLDRVVAEFPSVTKRGTWHSTEKELETKLSIEKEERFGPVTRQVLQSLNSSAFLFFLEGLTGIQGLVSDPHYRGGGLHQILRGGRLGIHADFNFYPKLRLYRRLNLLVYLNRDWKEEWGGHLEMWSREPKECVKKVLPLFNRAVIFDTSARSLHGHPRPLECPEGQSRKSLALYYYTVDYPHKDDLEPHSTIFYDPNDPNPKPA